MPHRIYTTAGFVIESRPYGEAGRMLSLFTRELGMVNAAAQGIRLSQSKLRYHAQDFSLAEFSLVRGRDLWRIVGAEKSAEKSTGKTAEKSTLKNADQIFVRILTVLRRLIHGEEKNEVLFEAILSARNFLEKEKHNSPTAVILAAEPIIMLRILHHLGYISVPAQPALAPFLADDSFAPELLEKMSVPGIKSLSVKEINKALLESQL